MERSKDNRSDQHHRSVAEHGAQSAVNSSFAYNPPRAVAQRKLAEMIDRSPRAIAQRELMSAIHSSTRGTAQRPPLGKTFDETAQRQVRHDGGETLQVGTVHDHSPQSEQSQAPDHAQAPHTHVAQSVHKLARGPAVPLVSPPVIQRKYELGAAHGRPDLTVTPDNDRAGEVLAQNLRGKPLGEAANSPSAQPFGWTNLMANGHTLANTTGNNSHYNAVRMHLWNGRLGGPGDETWNLAPGPAQINSTMSAGPETASKNATASGKATWLRTRVTYQNNSGNANDYTSVVPNYMEMEWGYMVDNLGLPSALATNTRGAAMGTWSTAIDQPKGALTASQQATYTNWVSGNTIGLKAVLDAASGQERAQAFELVQHDDLKYFILTHYDAVFLGMSNGRKGTILGGFSDHQIGHLLINTLGLTTSDAYVEHVLFPLQAAGHNARALALFGAQGGAQQLEMIKAGGWELLQGLGTPVVRQAAKIWDVFRLLPEDEQANQLTSMNAGEIDALFDGLAGTSQRDLLNMWAFLRNKRTTDDRFDFLKPPRLSKEMFAKYRKNMKHQVNAEKNPPRNQGHTRKAKKVIGAKGPLGIKPSTTGKRRKGI